MEHSGTNTGSLFRFYSRERTGTSSESLLTSFTSTEEPTKNKKSLEYVGRELNTQCNPCRLDRGPEREGPVKLRVHLSRRLHPRRTRVNGTPEMESRRAVV